MDGKYTEIGKKIKDCPELNEIFIKEKVDNNLHNSLIDIYKEVVFGEMQFR